MNFGLSTKDIKKIHSVFSKHVHITSAILYGSRAKGNYKQGSDIDLTLKGDNLTLQLLNTVSDELDDLLLPYKFDLSIFSTLQNQDIIDHIERVGVEFYNSTSVFG